ncbi:hypothetical protein NDU88_003378 [Pleurodeles waltl]|uniref:Uncharacterized protein n=1 Tax=Pleurodeles waltl TaxID=8319 RepID=A0AAV7M3T9_PLEWA|nr:hypothetical protein NDU88_003378 [Pleurodeles waltl]
MTNPGPPTSPRATTRVTAERKRAEVSPAAGKTDRNFYRDPNTGRHRSPRHYINTTVLSRVSLDVTQTGEAETRQHLPLRDWKSKAQEGERACGPPVVKESSPTGRLPDPRCPSAAAADGDCVLLLGLC